MIRYQTFTVICPCGICHRRLDGNWSMVVLGQHPQAVIMPDVTYDQMVADTLSQAEAALAEGGTRP